MINYHEGNFLFIRQADAKQESTSVTTLKAIPLHQLEELGSHSKQDMALTVKEIKGVLGVPESLVTALREVVACFSDKPGLCAALLNMPVTQQ